MKTFSRLEATQRSIMDSLEPSSQEELAPNPLLFNGYRIARNGVLSLLSQVVPGVAGIVCIPVLVRRLGDERFGLLTVLWLGIGYFSLFDFGLGRAVTKSVAEDLGRGDTHAAARAARTALWLLVALGVFVGCGCAVMTPLIAGHLLRISEAGRPEAVRALFLLSLAVPLVVVTTGARGILEAAQKFDLVNAVRMPTGVLSFVGPLLVVKFGGGLPSIVLVLIVLRVVGLIVYLLAGLRELPLPVGSKSIDRSEASRLISFGSWIAVSNLISPLMTAADRFVIGSALSVAAITYYATPFEAVSKVLLIPGAVSMVLFPAFASAAAHDRARLQLLYNRGFWISVYLVLPAIAVLILLAPELLTLWLSAAFAERSTYIARILSLGILANSAAQIPYSLLQGIGRSDVTAKLHLSEVGPYVLLLFTLLHFFGLPGVAVAWAARAIADLIILLLYCSRLVKAKLTWPSAPVFTAFVCTIAGFFPLPVGIRVGLLTVVITAGAWSFRGRVGLVNLRGLLTGSVPNTEETR